MDAFYVAVEVRRRPELAGLPVVVGGTGRRGVVAAAAYEARRFGVHSAMPSSEARRRCPHAVFLPGDHALYGEVSQDVHAILTAVTPLVEPIALDEAFLDVTGARRLLGGGRAIAEAVRGRVAEKLELSCSVGVAPVKMLAKLASEAAKPRATPRGVEPGAGVVVVEPGEEVAFLHPHPVQALWGVGPATLARLQRLGIVTVGDLAAMPEEILVATLGRANGRHLHRLANAVDPRPVEPDRDTKSIGHEQTFSYDLVEAGELERELLRMADAVAARLRASGLAGRTVTLKVRFSDFHTITRSLTLAETVDTAPQIVAAGRELLAAVDPTPGVRLLGVSLSHLGPPAGHQLSFEDLAAGAPPGWDEASRAVDEIRSRFGAEVIGPAALMGQGGLQLTRRGLQQWGPDQEEPPENGPS